MYVLLPFSSYVLPEITEMFCVAKLQKQQKTDVMLPIPSRYLKHREHYCSICYQQHQTVLIEIYSEIRFIFGMYQFPEDHP